MLFVRIFRPGKLYQFHLLKLVLADNAAYIFPIRSRLATKTWRVCRKRNGQTLRAENLVAIQIRDRHFGSGDKKEISLIHEDSAMKCLREASAVSHVKELNFHVVAVDRCDSPRCVLCIDRFAYYGLMVRSEFKKVRRHLKEIRFELRQLPSAIHRVSIHEIRREHFSVSMLARVQVKHEVRK